MTGDARLERPAYRIETERLVLRCYEVSDHAAVSACLRANLEHIRPWLPWADREPLSEDARIELMRSKRGRFDLGIELLYAMIDRDGAFLGGIGLHPRVGPGAIEIGYWIDHRAEGRGLVTEAAGALTRIAFALHGVERVEIHCDPENRRSAAVAERLGFRHEATLRRRARASDGAARDTMIWSLFRDELSASPAARVALRAFDAAGRGLALDGAAS